MKPTFSLWMLTLIALIMFVIPAIPEANGQSSQTKGEGAQPAKLTVGTNLVIVPVVVTDKRGEHITGLTAEDFEVKEDGKVQRITRFDELTAEVSAARRAVTSAKAFSNQIIAEHPKKLEIIALDQVNTPFASARDGHRGLVEFLAKNVDSNTLLALVALQSNGPRIIHDFTSDPSILVEAVKKLQVRLNSNDLLVLGSAGENSQADVEALQLAAALNGADVGNISTPQQLAAAAAAQRAQVDYSQAAQAGLITLESLQVLAQHFGGVPGRKSLIWASSGFPFSQGSGARSSTRGTTDDDWQRTFHLLSDANISVYPVDVSGLLPGVNANTLQTLNSAVIKTNSPEGGAAARSQQLSDVAGGKFVDPIVGRHETMTQLAESTGGHAFFNSNDGAELFRRAGQDASQYYLLSYYTQDTGKYGWRKIAVKVDLKDTKIRARSGFLFVDPKKRTAPDTVVKDLRMALSSDLSFTSIPLRGEWRQAEPAGDKKSVHFVLSIPAGVPSIDAEHQNHISLEFLVQATDFTGKNAGNISQRIDANLAADDVNQIQTKGLDYANSLTLPTGTYTVRFVVRDNVRSTIGSMVTQLKVE